MSRSRTVRMVAMAVLTAAVATLGFSGTALADPADDAQIMIDNLPEAAEILADGLQAAAADAAEHQSAVQASADIGDALVESGSALIAGTEQFGALGLGLSLMNGALQQGLAPYLEAIDDPSTAADLIDPNDVATILENLGPAVEAAQPSLQSAAVEGLRGNLAGEGLLGFIATPSLIGDGANGVLNAGLVLSEDTFLEPTYLPAGVVVLVGALAVGGAAGEYVQQVEDGIVPVAEAAAPATEPLIALIEGL